MCRMQADVKEQISQIEYFIISRMIVVIAETVEHLLYRRHRVGGICCFL